MDFTIIVAVAENNAIGKDNDLLWHISEDLKRFKSITTGHNIIMGRKTYESFPRRPLPNRRNIVLTSQGDNENLHGAEVVDSIESLHNIIDSSKINFIIGGGTIYEQFLPLSNKIHLTKVHKPYEADVFFPELNMQEWDITFTEEHLDCEPAYTYYTLERIK